jgi:cytochrome c
MKIAPSAAALAALLALSACGGGAQEDEAAPTETAAAEDSAPAVEVTPTEAAIPEPEASETPAPTAEDTSAPRATPSTAPVAAAQPAVQPASFAQCKACHAVDPGKNGIGPSLAGIWGEKAAEVPGFDFSQAMKDSGLVWNQANLDKYLADPRGTVPGTKMAFGGVKDATKRQELINYIKGL